VATLMLLGCPFLSQLRFLLQGTHFARIMLSKF